jgi:beta-galactosidase/beta-glucuronidase
LTRPNWVDCNGIWNFAVDDEDVGLTRRWWENFPSQARTIVVPYPPESPASGVGDRSFHRVVWYHRDMCVPERHADERLLLHVGACDYAATVWCNGHIVGTHEGGHTPFVCDLTTVCGDTTTVSIVIRAVDDPIDVEQPRGKQGWHPEPDRVWYPRTTGLWQPVWLEVVPSCYVSQVSWRTDLAAARVRCELRLGGRVEAERVCVQLEHCGVQLAEVITQTSADKEIVVELNVPALENGIDRGQLLWSPESPTLIDAKITLLDAEGIVDVVGSYFGIRDIGLSDGHFLLNGHPYFLRFALEQGLWPETHLAAPDDEALRHEVEIAKNLGFNGLRIHQKIEDPRFLYWCDVLGLMVWEEMPSCYRFGTDAVVRLIREWSEAVIRDRSHPCVVCWVPMNESWGVPDLRQRGDQQGLVNALVELTRALDQSRPVISNDGWEHLDSDILTIHDYSPESTSVRAHYAAPFRSKAGSEWPGPRRLLVNAADTTGSCVMVTEFGGLSLEPGEGQQWFGYGTHSSPVDLEREFVHLVRALLDSPEIAGFCYTQLTDTFQETNGLLDAARVPKIPLSIVRHALDAPAASVPHEAVERARLRARKPEEPVPSMVGLDKLKTNTR